MIKKTLGLILLILGIAIIIYSLYTSFNIFTGKSEAPSIFEVESQALSQGGGQGTEGQIQDMINEQLKGILPVNSMPNLLNLITWSIFAGILIFGGAQIAGLGIKLI